MQLQLGATTTGYYKFQIYSSYSSNTVNGSASSNAANWNPAANASTASLCGDITLIGPNLAKNTHMNSQFALSNSGNGTDWIQGYLANTTQYTDFTLICPAGTLTGGTIKVYGYQNS